LAAKSKYPENVYINDHTSVWGSWWNEDLGWGYACCHNNIKMSMCLGQKGHELALQR
jgi:pre-mRNA-processing factor SLU7